MARAGSECIRLEMGLMVRPQANGREEPEVRPRSSLLYNAPHIPGSPTSRDAVLAG
jgi:hypothetical protein